MSVELLSFIRVLSSAQEPVDYICKLGRGFQAAMAEWLRREIRNLLGSPRAGSNPVRSEPFGFAGI